MITDYATFEQWLLDADIDFSAAFSHGLLTAYCCKHSRRVDWAEILIPHFDKMNVSHKALVKECRGFQQTISEQLADEHFSFQLLLNEQADNIRDEVLSFREWVSGYWLGLQNLSLPPQAIETQSLEFIKDLPKIVSIALPENEDSGTLADLIELQEYCRVGVVSLFLASWQSTQG